MLETKKQIKKEIKQYILEQDWKIWIIYKQVIKEKSLNLDIKTYNEIINFIFKLKDKQKWENKLKIFELWAMFLNNKEYIK